MKRADHSGPSGQKVEPRSQGSSPGSAGQIGMSTQFHKEQIGGERGYKAPKDEGKTVHHCGSQGRR